MIRKGSKMGSKKGPGLFGSPEPIEIKWKTKKNGDPSGI